MLDDLLAFIAPHHCYLCQKTGPILCDCCKDYILKQQNPGQFDFSKLQANGQVFFVDDSQSVLKEMIYDYKLHSRRAYGRVLAQIIAHYLSRERNLVIVPAPTMRKSRAQRGFGHIELIADELAKLGFRTQHLLVNRSSVAQKELDAHARQTNVKDNLLCLTMVDPKLKYVVIDDITTTGSTLKQARRVLKQAGAKQVACLALVHA